MSEDTARAVIVVVIIGTTIGFLAITAEVMKQHPCIPWFGFGILATLMIEALIYGIYRLVKYIRGR